MLKQITLVVAFISVIDPLEYKGCVQLTCNCSRLTIQSGPCKSSDSKPWLVKAYYGNTINQTGWAKLDLETNSTLSDTQQAYFAGFLEGFLTSDLIRAHQFNLLSTYCENATNFCEKLQHFVRTNLVFLKENVVKRRGNDPFWHQVGLVLEQIQGVNAAVKLSEKKDDPLPIYVSEVDIDIDSLLAKESSLWINLIWDTLDIEKILDRGEPGGQLPEERCSAFIKLINNKSELLVAHNTWLTYNYMLRILKRYRFNFHKTRSDDSALIRGNGVAMSSYPGVVFSLDDFYVLSSNLTVTESSISNYNDAIYKQIQPDQVVFGFMRTIVANRLASTGKEWTQIYRNYNSGTFNNHFMVIDYNKFKEQSSLTEAVGVLWILEQTPGLIVADDVTYLLYNQSYWSAYNRPYFKAIFERGKWPKMVQDYGKFFSYNETARAKMFARDHVQVHNLKSMYRLMRYNDFQNDPYSLCNCTPPYSACIAIAARCDLNKPRGQYEYSVGYSGDGAIDVKLVNSVLAKRLEMIAVSGPTNDVQQTFVWSKTPLRTSMKHRLQPDRWDFLPVEVTWEAKSFRNISGF